MNFVRPLLIGGEWIETSELFDVSEPFTGKSIAKVSAASADEIELSIQHAVAGSKEMEQIARPELVKGLRRIAAELATRAEEIAVCIAREAAKPIVYSRGEVSRAIATFEFAASEAERFAGEIVPVDAQAGGAGKWARTIRGPRGVIYGITPFNFPLNLVAHKVAPALAARNSIVIKPSPRTPLTSLLLGEIFLLSGLPASALQIVPTDVSNVDLYLSDERINMVSFTGSSEVGWELKKKASRRSVALELGGNAPVIIDESADIDRSVNSCTTGAFAYSGQVCISVQRVYVHELISEEWRSRFIDKSKILVEGDPLKDDTRLSVMIDEAAAMRAENWIREAEDMGATVLMGGERKGAFLAPAILTNTDPEMKVVSEEVFAPVVCIESFTNIEEAITMANDSKFGLQAGIFSNDQKNIERAANKLQYGGVIINDTPMFRVDNMPYGGIKGSGFGREGVRYAMEEMSETKLVVYGS